MSEKKECRTKEERVQKESKKDFNKNIYKSVTKKKAQWKKNKCRNEKKKNKRRKRMWQKKKKREREKEERVSLSSTKNMKFKRSFFAIIHDVPVKKKEKKKWGIHFHIITPCIFWFYLIRRMLE